MDDSPLQALLRRRRAAAGDATLPDLLDGESSRRSDRGEEMASDEENGPSALDVGVMIEAMTKCVAFYHQTSKIEFYAMVAEEYETMLPDCEEVSVDAIERLESRLQQIASVVMSDSSDIKDVLLSHEVKPHINALLAFYKTLKVEDVRRGKSQEATADDDVGGVASPQDSVHSTGGRTDGSASNPATPQEDHHEEPTTECANPEINSDEGQPVPSRLQSDSPAQARRTSMTSLTNPRNSQFTYGHAHASLAGLTKAHASSKQQLRDAEELLKTEKSRTQQRKREYKDLKANVKQYRQREGERRRIRMLFEGDNGRGSDESDSESHRQSIRELRKLYRKETKRAKRLQETLTLKFQLLESENQRFQMKNEQLMTELRNEYVEPFMFGP